MQQRLKVIGWLGDLRALRIDARLFINHECALSNSTGPTSLE